MLDTDHTSIWQLGRGADYARLQHQIATHAADDLFFNVVSYHEQVGGASAYLNQARSSVELVRRYHLLTEVHRVFALAPLIEFDAAAAAQYDVLCVRYRRVGRMDLRIAAIALARGMALLTRNRSDFGQIANLAIEDWTA